MSEIPDFSLHFKKRELHLMLPEVTSILLTQNLYDILFQYVITPEKEEKLKNFIKIVETYIKSKPRGPFSLPLAELEFLGEGLDELKLLNWRQVPVSTFDIIPTLPADQPDFPEELDNICNYLQSIIVFNRCSNNTSQIYVYPGNLTGH